MNTPKLVRLVMLESVDVDTALGFAGRDVSGAERHAISEPRWDAFTLHSRLLGWVEKTDGGYRAFRVEKPKEEFEP